MMRRGKRKSQGPAGGGCHRRFLSFSLSLSLSLSLLLSRKMRLGSRAKRKRGKLNRFLLSSHLGHLVKKGGKEERDILLFFLRLRTDTDTHVAGTVLPPLLRFANVICTDKLKVPHVRDKGNVYRSGTVLIFGAFSSFFCFELWFVSPPVLSGRKTKKWDLLLLFPPPPPPPHIRKNRWKKKRRGQKKGHDQRLLELPSKKWVRVEEGRSLLLRDRGYTLRTTRRGGCWVRKTEIAIPTCAFTVRRSERHFRLWCSRFASFLSWGVFSVFAPPAQKVRNSFLFQGREERLPIRLYGAIRPKIRRSHWAAREEFLTFWAEWNSGGGVLFLPKKASRRSGGEKKGERGACWERQKGV